MSVDTLGDYLSRVERAYQGEVYGEALYRGIADVVGDPDRVEKWRVLAELELETKALMRELVAKLGGDTTESEAFRQKGVDNVQKYVSLPWADFMALFSHELVTIIARYRELEQMCAPEDARTLWFLTEHEVVTKAFCDLELDGRPDISIEPTRVLLEAMRAAR